MAFIIQGDANKYIAYPQMTLINIRNKFTSASNMSFFTFFCKNTQ